MEIDRWIVIRSHFNNESFYCRPGLEGAHEKGGVEGMIGYSRRNHFTPVQEVDSLAERNEMVDQRDLRDGHRRIASRLRTVDEYFPQRRPAPGCAPAHPIRSRPLARHRGPRARPDPALGRRGPTRLRTLGTTEQLRRALVEAAEVDLARTTSAIS
ncbi:hypothetical protein ACUN22_35850 [Streptomyces anulatus]|uniref:hypothetical protein n=1 Tax=Streptomyces anulatus TaxID=1892 RepID=UPI00403E1E17